MSNNRDRAGVVMSSSSVEKEAQRDVRDSCGAGADGIGDAALCGVAVGHRR